MTPARLRAPDKTLSISTDLDVVPLPVPELVRISGFATGEPYFGISGGNRFDAPGCLANSPEYATCYLGLSFDVAFAESLLHDAMPFKGRFRVASSEFDRRWVHRFVASLDLFDLTGHLLKTMGGHAGLSGTGSFKVTQICMSRPNRKRASGASSWGAFFSFALSGCARENSMRLC